MTMIKIGVLLKSTVVGGWLNHQRYHDGNPQAENRPCMYPFLGVRHKKLEYLPSVK